jgi:tripartite-type tricarboxylate transporter receptor subunit TctC
MTGFNLTRRSLLRRGAALGALVCAPSVLRAQSFATRPVRLFVGTAAAGSTDLVARLLAQRFEAALGQPVVVENRPGGATTLAVGLVGQAKPDGHTLLVSSAAAIAAHVTSVAKPPSLVADLEPVGMICDGAFIYAVHKDVPATNTAEFVALLKQEPGAIRFGATGAGGGIHLSGALFQQQTGTEMTVVQYANAGMRLNDLLANQTQLGIAGATVLSQQIEAGMLRPLFVAGTERIDLFPDLPTGKEQGIEGLEGISNWFGLHAPKGTSPEILAELNAVLAEALTDPKLLEALTAAGFFPVGGAPQALTARMEQDEVLMAEIAEKANIRVE